VTGGAVGSRLKKRAGGIMCDKCVDIDKTIERYRRILRSIGDKLTIDRTEVLIAELVAQKAALHPE
jgi:hypothetical protein